jgi:ribonuclease P protein component
MAEGIKSPAAKPRLRLQTLKSRGEYLAVRAGARWAGEAFVVEAARRRSEGPGAAETVPSGAPRFGFTVTKKMGNSVVRNRIRRRLKAVVASMPADAAVTFCDYVLIARPPALKRPFEDLKADLEKALGRVKIRLEAPASARSRAARPSRPR